MILRKLLGLHRRNIKLIKMMFTDHLQLDWTLALYKSARLCYVSFSLVNKMYSARQVSPSETRVHYNSSSLLQIHNVQLTAVWSDRGETDTGHWRQLGPSLSQLCQLLLPDQRRRSVCLCDSWSVKILSWIQWGRGWWIINGVAWWNGLSKPFALSIVFEAVSSV